MIHIVEATRNTKIDSKNEMTKLKKLVVTSHKNTFGICKI